MSTSHSTFIARARVPATSANLGPGFDALGLALQCHNFVSVQESPTSADEIRASGEGAEFLTQSAPRENIALIAARALLKTLDAPPCFLKITLKNNIPLARGLGSSSAAIVGALVAANEWARQTLGASADGSTLLSLAAKMEGHADNVAPALLGGLVVSTMCDDGRVLACRPPIAKFPRLVVFVPQGELKTQAARNVLPPSVPLADAAFNISRTGLLVAALTTGDWELLREATRDKLHQAQRAPLMPAYEAVTRAALDAGAYGATLSGAGPCILTWLPQAGSTPGESDVVADAITAMQDAAARLGVLGAAREMEVDLEGCVIERREVGGGR
jgi:homoserine kinase